MKIYDLHCDVLHKLWMEEKGGGPGSLRENAYHVDLRKMKQSNYGLQCFAAFVDQGEPESPEESAKAQIAIFHREMEKNRDLIAPVYEYSDISKNAAEGKMSGLLTIEGGEAAKGDLSLLEEYYRMGVRILTLTWNYENELGFPNINEGDPNGTYPFAADTEHGLKEMGFVFLERMEQLGMAVDVSHLSDAGFYDVAAHTKKPFFATHSNAREKASFVRNLTDDMIRILAERGGVTGINYCADFLYDFAQGEETVSRVNDMVTHIRHITDAGGIEVLALGSDFDGIGGALEMENCGRLELLADALKKAGFTASERDKIFYQNADRVFHDLF